MNITTRVHKVAQELRSAHTIVGVNPERPLGDYITFVPPWEDEFIAFNPLQLKCTTSMLSHHLGTQPKIITGFAHLLTHGLFARTTNTSGMTWLELMFISIAMTDHPMTLLQSSTAQAQVNLARQLREFATAATTTLRFALADTDQLLFLGSQKPPNRLAAFGYHNRTTHTSVHVAMSRQLQSALHLVMLSFKQALSPTQKVALQNGNLTIKTQKFAGYHTYKGGSVIMKLSECIKKEFRNVQSNFSQVPDQPCFFRCPSMHPKSADDQFDCFLCTKSIWCSACKSSHASSSFKCTCGLTWHKCKLHFSAPSRTCMVSKPARTTNLPKRPAPIDAAQSAKRLAKLETTIMQRACIGPTLAARFPHLVSVGNRPHDTYATSQESPGVHHSQAQSPS